MALPKQPRPRNVAATKARSLEAVELILPKEPDGLFAAPRKEVPA